MTPEKTRKALEDVRLAREAELKAQYDRSLPFADGMFDRWERARRLGFGTGASIYDSACVFGNVAVGAETWVGPWVMLDGSGGGIRIGSTCSLSAGVQVYTHDTVLWALTGGNAKPRVGAVSIGDRVYIGSQCVIARGVSIGDMCVIAANSFVNRDVPTRSIVGGTPAKVIGRVEGEGEEIRLVFNKTSSIPADLRGLTSR
jgi:carbonic anhydrase/acetyltransferase-like protein (isoleucine patch superfamily)